MSFSILVSDHANASDPASNTDLKGNIRASIRALSKEKPFGFFDLRLSEEDESFLRKVKINTTNSLGGCSPTQPYGVPQEKELTEFIKVIGRPPESDKEGTNDAIASRVSQIIRELVGNIIDASGKEVALVQIRAFESTSSFDKRRWHRDGYNLIHGKHEGDEFKFAINLKGPPTVFYKLPPHMEEKFSAIWNGGLSDRREQLAEFLKDEQYVSTAKDRQGSVFIVGLQNAAVHSEPRITEERLFLSIIMGDTIPGSATGR